MPIDMGVFLYLFEITKGRLRYIFGLLARLMPSLHIGDLTDRITLDIAKSMLIKLTRTRIQRSDITPAEEQILKIVVKKDECIMNEVAKEANESVQYVGKVLNKLFEANLLNMRKHEKSKCYSPTLDAVIAYSDK